MRIPVIRGIIKRRLLVNFRADPGVVQRLLPEPFRPKLHKGHSIVGVCLIRLEQIRPAGLPALFGLTSENAAHRIAVEWNGTDGQEEGVFIPRRDTSAFLNRVAGGRIFPGEHHAARFTVLDDKGHIVLSMASRDRAASVRVIGDECAVLPATSCFASLAEASRFFESGSLGYSATRESDRLDGLLLRTENWRVGALAIKEVFSSFFADPQVFPKGSIEFDHALVMRDLEHEWHEAEHLHSVPKAA